MSISSRTAKACDSLDMNFVRSNTKFGKNRTNYLPYAQPKRRKRVDKVNMKKSLRSESKTAGNRSLWSLVKCCKSKMWQIDECVSPKIKLVYWYRESSNHDKMQRRFIFFVRCGTHEHALYLSWHFRGTLAVSEKNQREYSIVLSLYGLACSKIHLIFDKTIANFCIFLGLFEL